MKTLLLLISLSLIALSVQSQEYDKMWVVGPPLTKMTFDNDSIILSQFAQDTLLDCFLTVGNICDRQGNLLMTTNGIAIHNRYGGLMPNGDSLSYPSQHYDWVYPIGMPSIEGVIILPDPGDTNQYYLFHYTPTDTINRSCGCGMSTHYYYSITDMRLDSGKGAVTEKNIDIFSDDLMGWSRQAACRHANGRDWWIVRNAWHTNIYYEFLLTPAGVQGPFVQQIGPVYGATVDQLAFALFSPDGTRYSSMTSNSKVVVMDFDRCTGLFSNPQSFFNRNSRDSSTFIQSGAVSAAFSPSGQYLYVNNELELNQYDVSRSPIRDSIRLCSLNDSSDFFHMNLLQLSSNGKIYISCHNGGSYKIHVINKPDSLGSACDFRLYGQSVLSQSPIAMPYYPNYRLGALPGSCDTIHTDLTAIAEAHPSFATITPVPATDHATLIWYTAHATSGHAVLYDISGRIVWSAETHSNQGTLPIDTRTLPSGTYLIHYDTDGKTLLDDKLIIAH